MQGLGRAGCRLGWSRVIAAGCLLGAVLFSASCASGSRHPRAPLQDSEPRRIEDAHRLAYAASQQEDPEQAILQYRAALDVYREFPAAWNNLGLLLMKQERLLEAEQAFTTAAELSATDPRPVYNRGLVWFTRGYVQEAREFFNQSLERDANYLPALRGSIRSDRLLNEGDHNTLERIRRALLLEQDERWREWMELQRIRVESTLSERSRGSF